MVQVYRYMQGGRMVFTRIKPQLCSFACIVYSCPYACLNVCMGQNSISGVFLPERRHGSTRVPGHDDFLLWRSSSRIVVYIYHITAAGNSTNSQLGSSCQGNRYIVKAGGAARPSRTKSHLLGHTARRAAVLGQPSSLRPHWFLPYSFREKE